MKNKNLSQIVRNDFYMDALMTDADSAEDTNNLVQTISPELQKVGFNLRKWISNSLKIMKTAEDTGDNKVLTYVENESIKTLGLQWEPQMDLIKIKVNCGESKITNKRVTLQILSKIYDTLGWLAPGTTSGKLFNQKLGDASENVYAVVTKVAKH